MLESSLCGQVGNARWVPLQAAAPSCFLVLPATPFSNSVEEEPVPWLSARWPQSLGAGSLPFKMSDGIPPRRAVRIK